MVVPRNHAKSTLFAHIGAAWLLLRTMGRARILLGSATLGLAKLNCGKVRDILEGDIVIGGERRPLAALFPFVRPDNRLGKSGSSAGFNVAGRRGVGKEASVFVGAPGSNLAGFRPTHAILDDITNEQNCRTRERRDQVIQFVIQVEALMYSATSPIWMLSTPWAPGDSTDFIASRPGWRQLRQDIYLDGEPRRSLPGERRPVCCPSFINEEEANEMEMTAIATGRYAFFSAQYRLRPMASEEPLFTEEMLRFACSKGIKAAQIKGAHPCFLLWDPVSTIGEGAKSIDRNGVAVVMAVPAGALPWAVPDPGRNVFLPVFTGEIAGGADNALAQIEKWVAANRWPNLRSIWIEEAFSQTFLTPWAKQRNKVGTVNIRGQRIPARDLTARLSGLQTAIREGYFVIPDDCEGRDLLLQRLGHYPVADFDDLPASLALLSSHFERRGRLPGDEPPPLPTYEQGGPGPFHGSLPPLVL